MKNLIILFSILLFISCKNKKDCDIQYTDILNEPLPQSMSIYSADPGTQEIILINSSCDNINIRNMNLGNGSNQGSYKLSSEKIKPGGFKHLKDLNFTIGKEDIYLKDKDGRLIHIWNN